MTRRVLGHKLPHPGPSLLEVEKLRVVVVVVRRVVIIEPVDKASACAVGQASDTVMLVCAFGPLITQEAFFQLAQQRAFLNCVDTRPRVG